VVLILLGGAGVGFGIFASGVPAPGPVRLDPAGETAVPRTYFFHNNWVLFGVVDNPRRVPAVADVGCAPGGELDLSVQPEDLTAFGSRVIDGTSVVAIAVLGRSGSDASMSCEDAETYEPLWLLPSSEAPAFTPTAIGIAGLLVLIAGLLTHPAVVEIPDRWRERPRRRS
jgi:hypothetical protein